MRKRVGTAQQITLLNPHLGLDAFQHFHVFIGAIVGSAHQRHFAGGEMKGLVATPFYKRKQLEGFTAGTQEGDQVGIGVPGQQTTR